MQFQEELGNLNQFKNGLMDAGRRCAVDSLVVAWSSELDAMNYSRIPSILDAMLLTAAVDNRKEIENLTRQIENLRSRIENFETRLDEKISLLEKALTA